jgi:hypothetical protein
MKILPTTYDILINGLLRLISQQWAALGVDVRSEDSPPEAIIDPEALLWGTLEIARYDPRLFDAVIEWLQLNHRWIAAGRFRRIDPCKSKSDIRWSILGSIAAYLESKKPAFAWQGLAKNCGKPLLEQLPLFLDLTGQPLPLGGNEDNVFARCGINRGAFVPRNRTSEPKLTIPANLLLKAKSFFGGETRAYIWTTLFVRTGVFSSFITEQTCYGKGSLAKVLNDFVHAGICSEERRQTAKWYRLINKQQWRSVLQLEFIPPWPNWVQFFQGAIHILRTCENSNQPPSTKYLLDSKLRRGFLAARNDLWAGGIPSIPIPPEALVVDEASELINRYLEDLLQNSLFINNVRTI